MSTGAESLQNPAQRAPVFKREVNAPLFAKGRDLNASLNILARGLSSLGRASGPKSSLIYRGEQSPNS